MAQHSLFGFRHEEVEGLLPETAPDDGGIVTNPNAVRKEPQPVGVCLGFSPPGYCPIIPDPAHIENQVAGMKKRINQTRPAIDAALLAKFAAFVQVWIRANLVPLTKELTFFEWLETTTYNGARKAFLTRCHEVLAGADCPKHLRKKINSFVKREQSAGRSSAFKFARGINSRSDYFKAYSGPAFKSIEQQLYKNKLFIKHVPVPDRPKSISALKRAGAKYFSTDYKSFEAHFSSELMRVCECELYKYMLSITDPHKAEVICDTIAADRDTRNHLKTRQGVELKLRGRRMSGDMCTSLGNGFTNAMLWAFFCAEKGVDWDGFVEGDDGIFAVYAGEAPQASDFERLGWRIEIEQHDEIETAGFCGCVYADGCVLRDPVDALCSFGWSFTNPRANAARRQELLRAKALSLAYELPACPILAAVADRALEVTFGHRPRFVQDGYHTQPTECTCDHSRCSEHLATEPSAAVRELFDRLYGVSPASQIECEHLIRAGKDDRLECIAKVLAPPAACATMSALYWPGGG